MFDRVFNAAEAVFVDDIAGDAFHKQVSEPLVENKFRGGA